MLSKPWDQRKHFYDFIIVGSGYGGAISAARIAAADVNPRPAVCILERGAEWPVGEFPDTLEKVLAATRSDLNPMGLYEFLRYEDISVIKGSGLGGTSLINANVAIIPDNVVFEQVGWPRTVRWEDVLPYYDRALSVLAARPHPRGKAAPVTGERLRKVQALQRRADEIGQRADALTIAVNFAINGKNTHGVDQKPCTDCGDCITGCNVGAKNTLYMNYLPMARNAGADIFTRTKVEWIEKLGGGGWRVHGRRSRFGPDESFTLEARNVILAAGSINSTEILFRSEMHGLFLSPALGTCFSGNGDFFGLSYNGDFQTDVLGYGTRATAQPGDAEPPGPSIVGVIRYSSGAPLGKRIAVEDFSFPSAYVLGAKALFATLRGEDTTAGNEAAERQRLLDDVRRYAAHGALNHTMLYLVMGFDDARGTMIFEAPWFEPDGRLRIRWDKVGQQQVFTRMSEELRRHARALRSSYIANPTWSVFRTGHLITAHPLGGCPMGEDYLHGAVDEFGRVFTGDGGVHHGLYVADGAVIRSALGVNPFLTISAFAERIAERKLRELEGEPYPAPATAVGVGGVDALEAIRMSEPELERLFWRSSTLSIDVVLNMGGPPVIDRAQRTIRNDRYWKGFFPKGHILNAMSSAIFTGFKKEFRKEGLNYTGVTSDTDGRIRARNSLEEITLKKPAGTLEAGEYILLKYLDFPWTGYYDILKVISDDLVIGRVYLGDYPNGIRLFTFAMTRAYSFAQMTADDHAALFAAASTPSAAGLQGVWRMDAVSNNNHLGGVAYLRFDNKPDGRLEARYQLMGLMEGLVVPSAVTDHFRLDDFTPFHDEIRKVDDTFLVGKYVVELPAELPALPGGPSLGILHSEPGGRFGLYYTLTRTKEKSAPTNPLLSAFLDVRLPDGVGLTFDEEMVGWYFPGAATPAAGRAGDLTIADRIPASGDPAGAAPCSFRVRMTARDLNEFIEGAAHEASMRGRISFGDFGGQGPVTFPVDEARSLFNYLRVNEQIGEAEMRYHIEFRAPDGREFVFDGRKYMQKDERAGLRAPAEVLRDYTTLYVHVFQRSAGVLNEIGTAYLKFRTFEDLAAAGNFASFLASFRVTGTDDPGLQLQARVRFLAFTGQFVQFEYDPLALPA